MPLLFTADYCARIAYQKISGEQQSEFIYGEGCKACVYTGYLGRTGIFELLTITDPIRQMLIDGVPAANIRDQAVKDGMISISEDGMMKVKEWNYYAL